MRPSPLRSLSPRRPAASSGPSRRPRRSLGLESLEVRQVLSAAPFVTGLYLAAPAAPGAGSLDYLATFSEAVTGVDAADFRVNGTGVTVTNPLVVTGQGTTYRLRVSGIAGQGTLGIDLVNDGSIRDASGERLTTSARSRFASMPISANGSYSDIAAGDFTADGIIDLAFSDPTRRVIDISPGLGDGTFATPTTYPAGDGAEGLLAVDLDADRHLDLVAVNRHESTLSVLLADGRGGFLPQTRYGTGHAVSIPVDVTTGDIDGDADVDLVIANNVGHSIGILLSAGDGTFSAPKVIPMGAEVVSVALADFNGDHHLDVAAALYDNRVTCLFGDGFGRFSRLTSIDTGTSPSALATGDLNDDGITDLVIAANKSLMTVLGSVTDPLRVTARVTTQNSARTLLVADVNGDGAVDVIHAAVPPSNHWPPYYPIGPIASPSQPATLVINEGRGDGTITAAQAYNTVAGATATAVADLNGDRSADIVVSGTGTSSMWDSAQPSVSIHLNDDGVYPGERATIDRIAPAVRSITAVDQTTTPTTGGDLGFTILFDETIDGFDTADLLVKATGTVTYASVDMAVKASLATVTIRGVRGTGTVRLGIDPAASISDTFGNPFDPTMTNGDSGAAAAVAIRSLATAPATPTVDQLHHGLRVRWTEPASDGGTPVTGYRLEYRTGEADPWSTIDLPASFRTLDIPALPLRARCDVRISALTGNGLGAASPPTTALVVGAPLPPVAVTAVTAAGRATVHWQAPTDDGGSPITHYVVRYRVAGQPGWMVARTAPAGARSSVIDGLTADTAYEFRVASWNAVGGTPAAPTAPATIPLGPALAPTGVSATPIPGGVALRWSLPGDTGGSAVTGHVVEYRRLKDAQWKTFRGPVSAEANAIVTDLDAGGGNYLFRVRAVTRAGAGAASLPSRAVSVAPVMPVATIAAGTARIDWRAFGSADGQPVIDYVVEYRRLRDTVWSVYDGLSTGTSATLTGLSTGANYTFRVRARSAFGPGATSAASPAVTIR